VRNEVSIRDGVLRVAIRGHQDAAEMEAMLERVRGLASDASEPIGVVLDVTDAGGSLPRARRSALEVLRRTRFAGVAVVGASWAQRMRLGLVLRLLGGETPVRYFASEEEALRWLRRRGTAVDAGDD